MARDPTSYDPRPGRLVLWTALAALALFVLQIVLTLPGGFDSEHFLGLGPGEAAEFDSMRQAWSRLVLLHLPVLQASLSSVAMLYFALDTIVFMPLYGLLLFEAARRLEPLHGTRATKHARRAAHAIVFLTVALLVVDLVENTSGLARLAVAGADPAFEVPWLRASFAAAAAAALAWWLRPWLWKVASRAAPKPMSLSLPLPRKQPTPAPTAAPAPPAAAAPALASMPRYLPRFLAGAALAAAALFVAHVFARDAALRIGAWVHLAKGALVCALGLVFLAIAIFWLLRHDGSRDGPNDGSHAGRAALRRGLADIVWRTRYVLIALGLLVGLTLVLDQCRDVAIGMAEALFTWPQALAAWPAAALSVLAVWALCFSCWLWVRLVCRVPAPGSEAMDPPADVEVALRSAARGAARLLGTVPAFVTAIMAALAARDALWAASREALAAAARGETPFVVAPVVLLVVGLLFTLGGVLFLRGREMASPTKGDPRAAEAEDYYNDRHFAAGAEWTQVLRSARYRFIGPHGPSGLMLPVLALALAVGARFVAVLSDLHVPMALPVIVFSLTAWLGFFGWLSMKEQREARPWLLILLVGIGALGFLGFTDNHAVRIVRADHAAALPALGLQVLGTAGLAAGVVAAAIGVMRSRIAWHWLLLGLAGVAVGWLLLVDRVFQRNDAPGPQARATLPASVPDLGEAFDAWSLRAWREAGGKPSPRIFLVASEGGGVRSAYWTARTLQQLHGAVPGFEARTLMLSGVSGGAVGEAVYRACAAEARGDQQGLARCIGRFGDADLLTPLLGAWLFEDVLGRVLPTSLPTAVPWAAELCRQPGCGFLSRGMWFEQALEHAVPGLAQGLRAESAELSRGPLVFLNATSVETGDRMIASNVALQTKVPPSGSPFTNSRDQLEFAAAGRSGMVNMPLSAAAHNAARFPFVNAIGRLANGKGESLHLADGGYFDNGGAHTTIDVLAHLHRWSRGGDAPCSDTAELRDAAACSAYQAWRRALQPTVIVIHNGVTEACPAEPADAHLTCLRRRWGRLDAPVPPDPCAAAGSAAAASPAAPTATPTATPPAARVAAPVAAASAAPAPPTDDGYDPALPAKGGRLKLFADLLGPLVTVVNVAGTGANGRRAEALLQRECRRFGAAGNEDCVVQLAQRNDGLLYPLGWYLSATARQALDAQAAEGVCRQKARLDR